MKKIVPLFALLLSLGCNTVKNLTTIKVASKQVDCQGVMEQKCLLVKVENQKEWEYFYDSIEGFTYEPGFEYVLEIKEEKIENPPADASSVRYILVKQISKIKKELKKGINSSKLLTIASKQVDCQGSMKQKCLLVKEGSQKEWEYFYDTIEGFVYETGFEYVLEVKEETIENPPADASSVKYILIKQVSKIKDKR